MTQPVTYALLKAEMEALAKVYVQVQAFAADSLVARSASEGYWQDIYSFCIGASEHIRSAMQALTNACEALERST